MNIYQALFGTHLQGSDMKALALALAIVMAATSAMAAEVKLTWTPNTEPDLAGYRIYQSDTSGKYDKAANKAADVASGPNEQKTASVLIPIEDGRTVYFVATAYDGAGNESGYSNEVSYKVPDHTAPAPPTMLSVMERIAGALETIVGYGIKLRKE